MITGRVEFVEKARNYVPHAIEGLNGRATGIIHSSVGCLQPRPQANSRYPNEKRKPGIERDSEKAWHKMAKKSQFSEKKSQIFLDENLLFFCEDQGIFRMYKLHASLPNI